MEILKSILIPFSELICAEFILEENVRMLSCIHVKKSKGEVLIQDHLDGIPENSDIPLIINISGSQIVQKRFESSEEALSFVENLNPNEFIIQKNQIDGGHNIELAFVRRHVFQTLSNKRVFEHKNLIGISLGGFSMSLIPVEAFDKNKSFQAGAYMVNYDEGHLNSEFNTSKSKNDDSTYFYDEEISANELLCFINAILFFNGDSQYLSQMDGSKDQYEELIYKKNTIQIGKFALIALFIMAILNFIVFSTFEYKKQDLEQKYESILPVIEKNKILSENIKILQNDLDKFQLNQVIEIAPANDQIISAMPDQIILNTLEFFPLAEKEGIKSLAIRKNSIQVIGNTPGPKYLELWIEKLNAFEWIEQVYLESYEQKPRNKLSEFLITIEL
ncbi:MAG: hypothetical protein RH860_01805 [Cytophagales bacterium]